MCVFVCFEECGLRMHMRGCVDHTRMSIHKCTHIHIHAYSHTHTHTHTHLPNGGWNIEQPNASQCSAEQVTCHRDQKDKPLLHATTAGLCLRELCIQRRRGFYLHTRMGILSYIMVYTYTHIHNGIYPIQAHSTRLVRLCSALTHTHTYIYIYTHIHICIYLLLRLV
jgi:hypothetical protein